MEPLERFDKCNYHLSDSNMAGDLKFLRCLTYMVFLFLFNKDVDYNQLWTGSVELHMGQAIQDAQVEKFTNCPSNSTND